MATLLVTDNLPAQLGSDPEEISRCIACYLLPAAIGDAPMMGTMPDAASVLTWPGAHCSRNDKDETMIEQQRYLGPGWFTRNIFNRAVRRLTRLGITVWGHASCALRFPAQ